jgi:YggT family protein
MSDLARVLARTVDLLANSLVVVVLARVVLSWVYPNMRNTLVFWVWRITEPILAPIRRLLPVGGRFDWSPVVALLLIFVVRAVAIELIYTWF